MDMGKLTYGFSVSVDGYVAGEDGTFDWAHPDDELHQYWNDKAKDVELSLYGRKLYELMAAFWPTADLEPDAPPVVVEFVVHKDAMVWPMVAAGTSNDDIKVARDMAPNWEGEDL